MTKLLIFGTGVIADIILDYYLDFNKAQIVAFVSSVDTPNPPEKRGIRVISPEQAANYEYHYVLIAAGAFDVIYDQCISAGIPEKKIIGVIQQQSKSFKQLLVLLNDEIRKAFNLDATNAFLKKSIPEFNTSGYYIANELYLDKPEINNIPNTIDSTRLHTLLGLAKEINENNVAGNIAELGVYQGDFACILNQLFPNRLLYLFDTFQGFCDKDIKTDDNNQNNASLFLDTSIELVLSKMQNRDMCKIYKGYFPESASGVDDIFSFVSLDADLFFPVYNGLIFFYERLSRNGYILIHDFNNRYFSGARDAVLKFCNEKKIGYTPVSDYFGSVVITK
jgi:hypothetical protein